MGHPRLSKDPILNSRLKLNWEKKILLLQVISTSSCISGSLRIGNLESGTFPSLSWNQGDWESSWVWLVGSGSQFSCPTETGLIQLCVPDTEECWRIQSTDLSGAGFKQYKPYKQNSLLNQKLRKLTFAKDDEETLWRTKKSGMQIIFHCDLI